LRDIGPFDAFFRDSDPRRIREGPHKTSTAMRPRPLGRSNPLQRCSKGVSIHQQPSAPRTGPSVRTIPLCNIPPSGTDLRSTRSAPACFFFPRSFKPRAPAANQQHCHHPLLRRPNGKAKTRPNNLLPTPWPHEGMAAPHPKPWFCNDKHFLRSGPFLAIHGL